MATDNEQYYDETTFKAFCENEAGKFVEQKYLTPNWTKNIRAEYAKLIFDACTKNLTREEGIFNVDGVDMDLAGLVGDFFKKHPHIDYVCPVEWRDSILTSLKNNFSDVSGVLRTKLTEDGENGSDAVVGPPKDGDEEHTINPNLPTVQVIKDVSNRIWSAWKVMSELVSNTLVSRFNSNAMEEKDFTNAVKLRDNLKKLAADTDDMALSFQIIKREKKEDKDGENKDGKK